MLFFTVQSSLNHVTENLTMLFHSITPVLAFGCLLLAGCDETSERMCDGFNHPLAEIWTENNGLGEVRAFAGSDGSQRNYVLESIVRSQPRIATGRGSDPNLVRCLESADYLYVESNSDVAFSFDFVQEDVRADSTIDNQTVRMKVDVQNPVGTSVENVQLTEFRLDDPERYDRLDSPNENSNLFNIFFIPEATINGVNYTDLLQHEFFDNSDRFNRGGEVVDDAKWVRMLLAKDVGLIQYELLSGEVFTLVRN